MTEQLIALDLIDDNPEQYREIYKDIEELGRNIAIYGLNDVPPARQSGDRFQLQSGHRRKRSFRWLRKNYKKEGLPERYSAYTVMPLNVKELTDDEMFDGLVIENAHRDDLKVTEKAWLLRRYKEVHPKATSEQIGLVFNMNGATVRGMDIFLDLPKEVQEKLDDGTITQGTARTLHSMQRVAPEAVIVATVNRIEKNKGNSLPDEVIEHDIEHLPNVMEMWDTDRRDGKPRSNWKNGWPLDMKNFPNKLLPLLTGHTAVQTLDCFNDKPAQKLVLEWAEYIAADAIGPEHENFDQEMHDACQRQAQKRLDDLAEINPVYVEQLQHLINPPACTACPFYTKIRGSHYCGMKACHTRKTNAWHASLIEQASKSLGIAMYETTDGAFRVLDYYSGDSSLFDKKHKGLRLLPTFKINGHHYQSFSGIDDDVALVVATGDALNKMSRAGGKVTGGKMTEKEKAERRAMKIYRAHRPALFWEYTAVAKSMFDAVPLEVLNKLNRWENIMIDDRIPEAYSKGNSSASVKGDYQRRALVWRLIMSCGSHFQRKAMTSILAEMQKLTGIKSPKALIKQAEQWDAEINAAAKPVAVETPKGKK